MSSSDTRECSCPRREPGARACRATRRGFTLIEVLAAVALLGILYAVLARVAIEGLRAEGDSQRRLEASLLADEHVNDLIGTPVPEVGHTETAEGEFAIAMDVTPFAFPPQWAIADDSSAPALLLAPAPGGGGGVQSLRTVQLTISWLEGASERHVSRTLFLLDFQAVAQLASAASASSPAAPAPTSTDEAPPPPEPDDAAVSAPEEP